MDKTDFDADDVILRSIYLFQRVRLKNYIIQNLSKAEIDYLAYDDVDDLSAEGVYGVPIEKIDLILLSEPDKTLEIIRRLKDEESAVFNYLYEVELPKIVRFIVLNSGNKEIAKDLFQEALVILIEKVNRQTLHIKYTFSTYLYSITRNLWLDHLKREKKHNSIIDEYKFFEEVEIVADHEPVPENYETICKVIETLGESCKRLLEYYYFKQMDWNEIAELLGYSSAGSARNQKFKCLERIRCNLNVG